MTDVWERRIKRAEALEEQWPFAAEVLRFYRKLAATRPPDRESLLEFLRQEAPGPGVEALAQRLASAPSAPEGGGCPRCAAAPQLAVLREDPAAETVRRTLLCSACAEEWAFPRVLCPNCREEQPEKLVRLTAQEIPWVRVEACDSCKTYLKAVDLTKCPEAEPVVDELASLPLDLIAREQGYTKIVPNLAGL